MSTEKKTCKKKTHRGDAATNARRTAANKALRLARAAREAAKKAEKPRQSDRAAIRADYRARVAEIKRLKQLRSEIRAALEAGALDQEGAEALAA